MEVKVDPSSGWSASMQMANRADVKDRRGVGTHAALANDPKGLGLVTQEGVNRYRVYNVNGRVIQLPARMRR